MSSLSDLEEDDDSDFEFAPQSFAPNYAGAGGGGFITKSVGDRYDAVFGTGSNPAKNKIAKEVIVGDIIAGPRARTNRLMRREWDRRKGV